MKLHGAAALTGKVFGKVLDRKNRPVDYSKWIVKHLPDKAELAEEENEIFQESKIQYRDPALQNTGEIPPAVSGFHRSPDLRELGALSF